MHEKEADLKRLHTVRFQLQYMTFWQRQNCGDSERSVVAKDWRGGRVGQTRAQRIYRPVKETILCHTLMVDTCHYTFVKTHRPYYTKSDRNISMDLG